MVKSERVSLRRHSARADTQARLTTSDLVARLLHSGDEYPGLSTCTFDTYRQCLASAWGRNLACIANSYFGGESDDPYALSKLSASLPP